METGVRLLVLFGEAIWRGLICDVEFYRFRSYNEVEG